MKKVVNKHRGRLYYYYCMPCEEVANLIELVEGHGGDYYAWQERSFCPDALPQLLRNVRRTMLSAPEFMSQQLHIIFPECGCAFLEWHVLIMLLELSPLHRHRVTLMDVLIDNQSIGMINDWRQLAMTVGVDLETASSYCELERVLNAPQMRASSPFTLVIYINGAFRFHKGICPEPDTSRHAACRFWEWCQAHAINKTPINYVGSCTMLPAGCETWEKLAEIFREVRPEESDIVGHF
jgi:hypothetical protein